MAKKRREAPPKAVESDDDSEESDEDDGVMGDEFEGSEEVESEEEGLGFESESEEEAGGPAVMERIMEAAIGLREREEALRSDVDSMEGSRSRSEEDLRDIGSARRLDDDDTGDSAWKETAGAADGAAWGGDENAGPSSSAAPDAVVEKEKSGGDGAVVRVLDSEAEGGEVAEAIETDDEEDDQEDDKEDDKEDEDGSGSGEAESQSEGEPSGFVSVQDGSDSDTGSGGKGEKGDSTKDSAYSRAYSKILKQSKVAKASDTVRKMSWSGCVSFL